MGHELDKSCNGNFFKLGELTARWIRVGNFFHKVSVVFGMTSLVLIYAREDRGYIYIPFGLISVLNAGLYAISYRDPCCKYQLETSTKSLEKLPLHDLSSFIHYFFLVFHKIFFKHETNKMNYKICGHLLLSNGVY
jgi:hypothetical protein